MRSLTEPPAVIVLDIDSTDDPTHGQQQLSFFHGYYDQHMYHPLLIFDGERGQLVSAVLRPGNAHAARGAMGVLRRIIRRLKQRFPHTQMVVRGDSAFAVPRVLRMLEELDRELGGIAYVIGLAQNAVLLRSGAAALSEARLRFQATKQTVQHFDAFAYAAETWPQARHVVMKAEVSEHGANPRFVVTSLPEFAPALLYHAYCERGQCENFIKDFKNALQADRLSCSTFAANFFRLLEHAAAYVVFHALRTHVAPLAPQLGRAQFDTLRLQLLKVAALVSQSTRRLLVRLPSAFPLARVFRQLALDAQRGCPSCPPRNRILITGSFSLFAVILTSAGRSSSPLALRHLSWPAAACEACSFFSALHELSDARFASGRFVQLATFLSSFMNNPGCRPYLTTSSLPHSGHCTATTAPLPPPAGD